MTATNWPHACSPLLFLGRAEGPYLRDVPDSMVMTVLGSSRYQSLPRFIRDLRAAVQEHCVDVIVAFDRLARIALFAKLLRLVRVHVVVVERNMLSVRLRERFTAPLIRQLVLRLTRSLYRNASAIVGVSSGVTADLSSTLGIRRGRIATIENPLEPLVIAELMSSTVQDPLSDEFLLLQRPIVLTVGRLVPQKAHRDLLEAFARLPDRHRGSLVILGEGPLRDDLQHHAEQLGITDHLWMPGFVDNPWWFIHRADLFCLPSHHEGHPRALLEALACRVPIVATDCPSGPREILGDLPGTRLVPVADPHALTAAITETLDTPIRPDADLTPYTPTHIARQYADLIDQMLADGP